MPTEAVRLLYNMLHDYTHVIQGQIIIVSICLATNNDNLGCERF